MKQNNAKTTKVQRNTERYTRFSLSNLFQKLINCYILVNLHKKLQNNSKIAKKLVKIV